MEFYQASEAGLYLRTFWVLFEPQGGYHGLAWVSALVGGLRQRLLGS